MDSVFDSVFSSIDAIVYRCRNDRDYTIDSLYGSVQSILGYSPSDILGNAVVSWVGMTAEEDEARLFEAVDAAISQGRSWDVDYRMRHAKGHYVWVRARGAAKFENGELAYLEGLVVSANAEVLLRKELAETLEASRAENRALKDRTQLIMSSLRQLTMLSVNARIEAARSGQAGRGFAVVAEAIKDLAEENGTHLSEISEILQQSSSS
jgi:hypothetical protein